MKTKTKILKINYLTHDVKSFTIEKPLNYKFIPGQATNVSIDKLFWRNEERPFTFSSLPDDKYLEFIIKRYSQHKGVTEKIHKLLVGDSLIIRETFGAISYKGKGIFIAGGAGITPFISIFRYLRKYDTIDGNKLFFSNKTKNDIILEDELKKIFENNKEDLKFILTEENNSEYYNGIINEEFFKKNINNFNQKFYVCGPPQMVEQLTVALKKLGANINSVIFENK